MPVLRRQLPAYSPLTLAAVAAGARGSLRTPPGLRSRIAGMLRAMYAGRDALLVGSGTDALRLALAGVRATVSRGPVALPAYSCYDIATAADGADAPVVLYDIDASTLGPDEPSLLRALESDPVAIVGAHLYGYPVDVERLARHARDAGAVLIEDAAQSAGGRLGGAPLGTFGSLSVFSFGRGKGTTAGSGGALVAHDDIGERVVRWAAPHVASSSRGMRELALLGAQWMLGRPALYGLPAALPFLRLGETVYHAPRVPRDISGAALGTLSITLDRTDAEPDGRRVTATRLAQAARRSARVSVIDVPAGAAPGYLRLPLIARGRSNIDVARELMHHGVAVGYPTTLASLRPFRDRIVNRHDDFPGATQLARELITFPTHGLVGEEDLVALEQWLRGDAAPRPRAAPVHDSAISISS